MTDHVQPTDAEYVANPVACPLCGSDRLVGARPQYTADPRQVHATMTCDACGNSYTEVYTLAGWTK